MKYTSAEYIELMRTIWCMGLDEFLEMFDRTIDTDPGGYVEGKYFDMRKDLFSWLAQLDLNNQEMVMEYASKKCNQFSLQ